MTIQYHPDIHYWLAAMRIPSVGPIHLRKWLDRVGDIKTIFLQSQTDLISQGLNTEQISVILHPNWDHIERQLRWCQTQTCHILTWDDAHYPILLSQIPAAPSVLFVQGDIQVLNKPQLAIVGSRYPTVTGLELAKQFAKELSRQGLVITSGLAQGIDTACHQAALDAGCQTIAVFGSGLKHIYPPHNRQLAEKIAESGALVSEFFPDALPKALHFPQRNRIISGLSLGVFVVEAAVKSGSLITARYATEQGRDVFAIPGSIHNPQARGCHYLIRQGAKLVETAQDIVEELAPLLTVVSEQKKQVPAVDRTKLDEKSQYLLTQIGYEITALDAIIIRSGLTAGEVSSMLLRLELNGYIQTVLGGYQRV